MKRTLINDLKENEESLISGFIEKIRDTKYMVFIILKDISGTIQVSIDKNTQSELVKSIEGIIAPSVLEITGQMVKSEYVKQGGKEFIPKEINVLSEADALPIDETANIDTRLDYRWLDLRSEKNTLIFQAQSAMVEGMRQFLIQNKFIEIHTPKLIATASESGSDVFEVKYFKDKAYLAQSPQFYKQMAMAAGFERIFEIAPAFRAENSNTNRHTTEFTSFDLEFSYIKDYTEVMDLEEELIIAGLTNVKEKYGEKIKELYNVDVIIPTRPFPRITL